MSATTAEREAGPIDRAAPEPAQAPAQQSPPETDVRYRWLRVLAVAVWGAAFGWYCDKYGVPLDRGGVFLWVCLALVAASIGKEQPWRVVLDFLPFGALLVGYDYLKVWGSKLGMPTQWHFQLDADKFMFGGHSPTVFLQSHLKFPTAQWWEVPLDFVYLSYFPLAIVTAAVLRRRDRRQFLRWTARFVGLCVIAFSLFTLMPSAPPWAAARCTSVDIAGSPYDPTCMLHSPLSANGGMLGTFRHPVPGTSPFVERLTGRGLHYIHFNAAQHLLHTGQLTSDAVAAVPSMHSAGVMLFALFMWRRVRRRWRPLLALYPVALGFTLVWGGEHYVTDVLAGWLAAALVMIVGLLIERLRRRRRATRAERTAPLVPVEAEVVATPVLANRAVALGAPPSDAPFRGPMPHSGPTPYPGRTPRPHPPLRPGPGRRPRPGPQRAGSDIEHGAEVASCRPRPYPERTAPLRA